MVGVNLVSVNRLEVEFGLMVLDSMFDLLYIFVGLELLSFVYLIVVDMLRLEVVLELLFIIFVLGIKVKFLVVIWLIGIIL